MSGAGASEELSPFVGRATELGRLMATLEQARSTSRPATVVLVGEAGIGKSRLVREFVARAAERHSGLTVLHSRCPPGGAGSAYWPLAEALRDATGASLAQDARTAATALRRHLRRLFPARGRELTELTQALAVTAGLPLPKSLLERAEPRAVEAAILRAWPRYLSERAGRQGAIIVVEDVHWADPQLLRVVESVHAAASGALLLLLTGRPELAEGRGGFLERRERWTVQNLAPLPRRQGERLVRELLHAPDLGGTIAGAVAGRAGGSPLYIEETIRLLTETGALRIRGSTTEVVDTARLVASPATISGLLAARIEALPDGERRVLQTAATVGRRFWDGAVARALRLRSVQGHLASLEGRGLIRRRAASSIARQHEYVFKHALIRDAAYEAMPQGRRARSHAAVGSWLESITRDRVAEVDAFVAEHYRRSVHEGDAAGIWQAHPDEREELRRRAFGHLVAAGAEARRGYALDRAADLHRAALDLAAGPSERAEALEEIGEDHETGLRGEEAMATYLDALDVSRNASVDPERRARICMKGARTLVMRWGAFARRPDPALMDRLIDEGLEAARDPATRCWLLALNGGAAVRWRADARKPDPISLEERLDRTRMAVEAAPGVGLPDLAGFAARILGQLEFEDGRFDESRATMRSIRPLLARMHSKFQRSVTSMYVFLSLADVEGRYADALRLAEEMVELGREMSPHEHMHGTFGMLWALHHLGRWSEMPALVSEHLEALEGEGNIVCPFVRSGPLVGALSLANLGDAPGVEAIRRRIKPTWESPGLPEMLLARIETAQGNPTEGLRLTRQIIDGGRLPNLEENAFDVLALVEALQALGEWDALREAVRHARRWEQALALMQPFCDRAEGLIALAAGQRGPGITRLRAAGNRFSRLAVRYEEARTKALLAHAMPDAPAVLADAIAAAEPLLAPSFPGPGDGATSDVPPQDRLTDREVEVLGCVAEGLSNELIATRLAISMRTVERHLSNIYEKLGVSGKAARAAATAHAFKGGLVEPSRR
ncbi:MAG: helix-turn-helix transcriptional regulator [Candidatus Limnocylindria bacterium]